MAARTAEERIALIDAKIAKKKEEIKALEAPKAEDPPSRHHALRHGKSKSSRPHRGRDRGEAGA